MKITYCPYCGSQNIECHSCAIADVYIKCSSCEMEFIVEEMGY